MRFEKYYGNDSLVYDTNAFFYYLNAVSIFISVVCLGVIVTEIWKRIAANPYRYLPNNENFKSKIINTNKLNSPSKKIIKLCVLLLSCIAFSCICLSFPQPTNNFFNPYQILNISPDASLLQIKKSFRKLSLTHHPDKNSQNNFILISKAYKCLTTPSSPCFHSNWEQQTSYRMGIGLPQSLISHENSIWFAVAIFCSLMAIGFGATYYLTKKQTSNRKQRDGNFDYRILYRVMNLDCDGFGFSVAAVSVADIGLEGLLSTKQEQKIRGIVQQKYGINSGQLTSKQIHAIFKIYEYMGGLNQDLKIAQKIPQISQRIIKFSLVFAKKSFQQCFLYDDSDLIIKWYGLLLTRIMIRLSQHTFNQSYNQQLNKQQQFQSTKYFPLQLQTNLHLQQNPVNQLIVDDMPELKILISLNDPSQRYISCAKYPLVNHQRFVLLVSRNSNLISSFFFKFQEDKLQICHTLKLKKLRQGSNNLVVRIESLSNPQCYQERNINFYVFQRLEKRKKVILHEQDKKVELVPKNFFEKLITVCEAESDLELSQSQQQQKEQNEVILKKTVRRTKKKKAKKIQNESVKQNKPKKKRKKSQKKINLMTNDNNE